DETLAAYVMKNFDMRPRALIEELDLLRPVYQPTSSYGHFGRSEFTWEKTDRAKKLAADLLGSSAKSNGKANGAEAAAAPAKKAKGKAQARA
ncbi:MAG: methionine adenosyltransferase domain-containing protein, partial [Pseudomonadota bacterium]